MSRTPNLRDIQTFNTVAVELSFRRAAERLAIDQSAVSRRVRELEETLGYQLLRRTTREVSLTAAGQVFHERTRQIARNIDEATNAGRIAAEGKFGRLRVGYMSFAAIDWMPISVAAFTKDYPNIELELRYMHTSAQKIALSRNEIDVGFMLGPVNEPEFEKLKVASDSLVALLPDNHKLSASERVFLSELAAYPIVMGSLDEWDVFREFVDRIFAQQNLKIFVRHEASTAAAIIGLVRAGLGASLYSSSIGEMLPHNLLVRPIADEIAKIDTFAAWNRAYKTPALMNFVKSIRQTLKALEAAPS